MHISAHLAVDVIAHETSESLSVLVELAAPVVDEATQPPVGFQVVLDRSGSMAGAPLDGAKTALLSVVDRLPLGTAFGVVAFDDQARIVVPAGPLTDKAAVKRSITAVQAGGSTDLSAGFLLGLAEARRAAPAAGTTLCLISDGHANVGERDPGRLGPVAAKAYADGVTTSAMGYGSGYDETLLSALACAGGGNETEARSPDEAAEHLASELTGLLSQAAQAVQLLVRMSPCVQGVQVVNELPTHVLAEGVLVELGGLYGGETRKLVLTFDIPAVAALGLAQVAALELRYTALPSLRHETVMLPLAVNVVPGDAAAGRLVDPVVHTELAYQQAQRAKRRASSRLSRGDAQAALVELVSARRALADALDQAPDDLVDELREEVDVITSLEDQAQYGDVNLAAKYSSADATRKGRQRGRRSA